MKTSKRKNGTGSVLAKLMATVVAVVVLAGGTAQAASITYLGSDTDTLADWRTTSVAKPAAFDPNGDNAYGSDGYLVRIQDSGDGAGSLYKQQPSYVSSLTSTASSWVSPTYGTYDDPREPIGAPPNISFGLYTSSPIWTFTLDSDAKFVVTVCANNRHDPDFTLEQTVGGNASASADWETFAETTDIHYHFFEVNGKAGDEFEGVTTGTTSDGIGAVAFEIIPEPTSLALLALVGGLLWFVRRKVRA